MTPALIAASLDGSQIAVLDGDELSLFASGSLEMIARILAPGHARDLVFCGRDLLVHSVSGAHTILTVLSLPRLTVLSQLEVDSACRYLATTHHYALFDRDGGAFVVHCTPTTAAIGLLRLEVSFGWAVGLEEPQFMTWGGRGSEIWDASTRRPLARVALDLPSATIALGLSGQQRWLWALTEPGGLQVARLSDGRTRSVPLGGTVSRPVGHPMTSWLVADLGGEAHGINIVLGAVAPIAVPPGPRVVVPNPAVAADAMVLVATGDRLARAALSTDPARRQLPPPIAPARADAAARPRTIGSRLAEKAGRAPAAPAAVPQARTSSGAPWRADLLAWTRQIVSTRVAAPLPFLAGSPLDDVVEHGALGEAAARVLHALYGHWLEGHADIGIAVAVLSDIAGAGDGWSEALGSGQLGALGLVVSELGRTRLAPAVGAFLDGQAPRHLELVGEPPTPRLPHGRFRIAARDGESPRDCAARLARDAGEVALCEPSRHHLGEARLEAWLRQRPLVTPGDPGPIELRPTETFVEIVPAGTPDAPGAPWWNLAG